MNPHVVLLVDDNPDDIALTRWAFKKHRFGVDIIVARDGSTALDLLLPDDPRDRLRPAIVLLDIDMPTVSGLHVLHTVRAHPLTTALPVVILTGSTHGEALIGSYDQGANAYLRKPVDPEQFLQVAQSLGVLWPSHSMPPRPAHRSVS